MGAFSPDIVSAALRARRRRRYNVAVPFAPTKKGKEAEVAAARRRGHQSLLGSLHFASHAAKSYESPYAAAFNAALGGEKPPSRLLQTNPNAYRTAERLRISNLPSDSLGQPEDLTNLIVGATGVGDIASILRGAGQVGLKELGATAAKDAASTAASTAEKRSLADVLAGIGGKRAALRGAVKRGAQKAEPDALRAARQGFANRAGAVAKEIPAPLRTAGKTAGRAATLPVRRPFTSPLALQAPVSAAHGELPNLKAVLEGKGALADLSNTIGSVAQSALPGAAGHLAKEAINLPAVALPSVFLPAEAGVEAAQGDSKHLNELWDQWKKTGLLPAAFSGNLAGALKALKERPLYSGLEALGAEAAAGRGIGAVSRLGGRSLARPDVTIPGYPNLRVVRGPYSKEILREGVQRLADRRSGSQVDLTTRAGKHRFERLAHESVDRFQSNEQDIGRLHRNNVTKLAHELIPTKRKFGIFKKLDKASANVMFLAIERIARHPSTFHEDLTSYKHNLEAVAKEVRPDGTPVLDRAQLKANQEVVSLIDKGLKRASPEHVVEAADAFIAAHQPIVEELVKRGALDPHQAAKAAAIPFAVVHMGATHGEPVKLYRDLELQHKAAREAFRGEARAALGGHIESHQQARARLQYAESGWMQAERSLATARANLKDTLASRKTEKGQARVMKRLEQAESVRDAAKKRVATAEAEIRQTGTALQTEARRLKKVRAQKLSPIEARLSLAKQIGARTLDQHGYPLTLEQIAAEMKRHGIEPAGFLSHRPSGNSDFWAPWAPERGSLPKGARTGASALQGTRPGGFDTVLRQLVRSQGLLDRVKTFDNWISQFGVDLRGHGIGSMKDAWRVSDDPARYGLNPNIDWVPVRRHAFLALKREMEGALEHQDPTIASEGMLSKALGDALDTTNSAGPIVFMPREVVQRIAQHFQPYDTAMKRVQAGTTAFKRAVLPFSPSFYYGNAIDNIIRTGLAGIGPHHALVGYKVRKHLTEEGRTKLVGGSFYSSVEKLAAHRSADALFQGHKWWEASARAISHWADHTDNATRTGRITSKTLMAAPRAVSALSRDLLAFNSLMTERLPQYGAVGKVALDEFRATQGSWIKALRYQDKLASDFAKGVQDPATLTHYQKAIEEIYGNWSRMGPKARRFWSNVAPFWTWMRAAYKFVYVTLPAHHPIQTGILTAMARGTQKEREELGLDKLGTEPVPNWLQGALPINGGLSPWAKYQSFGFAGNPVEGAARTVLSQISSVLESLRGRNWKGEEISGGELAFVGAGFGSILESFVPGVNLVKGLLQKGPEYLSPLRTYPKSEVEYLRRPTRQITVPVGGSSSSSTDLGNVFGGSGGSSSGSSSTDLGAVFGR